jgi:hypothetical protein
LAGSVFGNHGELTVFYLKHAKASAVAETLEMIFSGGASAKSSGGGSLIGDLAGAAVGQMGGGMLGSLLSGSGSGGTIKATGAMQITPDNRLNALIVEANPTDLDTIEELLKILDQKESPEEILVTPKPRMIAVRNIQAQDVAEIVKQVYQERMAGSSNQQARPPSPQEFIQMLRGGQGSGNKRNSTEDMAKMSIGIDSRTNSLIVAAPDSLFRDVESLVTQLDQAASTSDETMEVVTVKQTNAYVLQQALSAMTGSSVTYGRTGQKSSTQSSSNAASGSGASQQPGVSGFPMQPWMMQGMQRSGGGFGGNSTGNSNSGFGGRRNSGGFNSGGGNRNSMQGGGSSSGATRRSGFQGGSGPGR